jgi:hypothetical protein
MEKRRKYGGRKKGTPNKTDALLKDGFVPIVEKSIRRSRQTLGTEKLRAQVIDLVARNISTQQYKHCHGKFT